MDEDLYEQVNVSNLRRLTAVGWVAGGVLTVALLAVRGPTHAIGDWGWVPGVLAPVGIVAGLLWFWRHPDQATRGAILAGGYVGTALVALLQWLSGGWAAPYHQLLLLFLLNGTLGHPPRRYVPLYGAVVAAALLPELYAPDRDLLVNALFAVILWTCVGAVCAVLMRRVHEQRRTIGRLANRDTLTGLANRRAFEATAQAAALDGHLSLAIGDVNDFKGVNDAFGHPAGDRCLVEIAAVLAEGARSGDSVYRWGGDEFALLLPGTDAQHAEGLCRRLEARVADRVRRPDGRAVTITLGSSELNPAMGLEDLLRNADAQLLARKPVRRIAPRAAHSHSTGELSYPWSLA